MWIVLLLIAAEITPEERAVTFLSREVPAWSRENHCYSCHNNGDGARALYAARASGYTAADGALEDTEQWLRQPARWDDDAKHPSASDRSLASLQFAAALAASGSPGPAARVLLGLQHEDGSWPVETGSIGGSPITWGTPLATVVARGILRSANRPDEFGDALRKADAWLRAFAAKPHHSVLDESASVMAFPSRAVERLLAMQNSDGGWGPRANAPSEAFDTAVVLLALTPRQGRQNAGQIAAGRKFLVEQQLSNGGWPETTRPAGQQSYAHHVSTTAWAAMALFATDPKR